MRSKISGSVSCSSADRIIGGLLVDLAVRHHPNLRPTMLNAEGGEKPTGKIGPFQVTSEQTYRPDIQGIRALAVLLVIADHAGIAGFSGGYIGVDLFFVVSGYVITQLLLRETRKGIGTGLADFYARRVRRIVPAATITLVATVLIAWAVLGARFNPQLPGDVRWASLFSANFRLIETGSNYFVPGIFPSLITQFWSLGVEEQFYLCFPLVVFLVARFAPAAHRLAVLAGFLTFAIVLSAWWSIHLSVADPTPAYYSPFTRFWELGLGCLLAVLTTHRPTRTPRSERFAVTIAIGLLVVGLIKLNPTSVYPGALAWLPCAAAALLIWAGIGGQRNPMTRVLSCAPLGYLGDLSYSLYLTHYVWLQLPAQLVHPLTSWPWRILELAGTFVSAAISYHLLENPIRRSRRLAADPVSVALVLCVCIAASWTASILVDRLAHVG
jgi:peptidoglycan/LPS O-acetylase OafA/YrhL